MKHVCIASISTLLLFACSPHNIDHNPDIGTSLPKSFYTLAEYKKLTAGLQKPWWESFERPPLTALIEEALEKNKDLESAIARVRQARALSKVTGAERLPAIDIEGDYNKTWRGGDEQRASGDVGGALSWEIDLFNRIGSATLADELEARAREYDAQALKLTISAEVANAYFGAVAAHRQLQLLQEQLKLDQDLLELLELRLENGVGTNVDVLQQKARVADSKTLIPRAESDLAVFENRLDVLMGKAPDGENRVRPSETLSFATSMPDIGVPASLLLKRPDLQAARAELVAADADIAAAIADRLPQVTLDGSYVFSDSAAFTGPVSALMSMFVQPLFDWGKRKAEVERNQALYEERLAAYTQLFLEAVEDTENALIQEQKQREFLQRLEQRREILQQTVDASEDRYTQGIDDYLLVINALQELREVERDLITEHLELVNIRISLFRAIGGPLQTTEQNPSNKNNNGDRHDKAY